MYVPVGTHTKTEMASDLDILQVNDIFTLRECEMRTRIGYNDPVFLQVFGANTTPHGLEFIGYIMDRIFLTVGEKKVLRLNIDITGGYLYKLQTL